MPASSRILVVEDDETLRETIRDVMTDDGHEVRMAADGQEALEHLRDWEADVVILDVMMPRMDAFQFRDRHRATDAGRAARVLVISAATDVESAARRLHASAWLAKPFTLDEMIGAVNRLLRLDRPPEKATGEASAS